MQLSRCAASLVWPYLGIGAGSLTWTNWGAQRPRAGGSASREGGDSRRPAKGYSGVRVVSPALNTSWHFFPTRITVWTGQVYSLSSISIVKNDFENNSLRGKLHCHINIRIPEKIWNRLMRSCILKCTIIFRVIFKQFPSIPLNCIGFLYKTIDLHCISMQLRWSL